MKGYLGIPEGHLFTIRCPSKSGVFPRGYSFQGYLGIPFYKRVWVKSMWGWGALYTRRLEDSLNKVSLGIPDLFYRSYTMAYSGTPVSLKVSLVSLWVSLTFTEITGVTVAGPSGRMASGGARTPDCGAIQKNTNGKPGILGDFTEITEITERPCNDN